MNEKARQCLEAVRELGDDPTLWDKKREYLEHRLMLLADMARSALAEPDLLTEALTLMRTARDATSYTPNDNHWLRINAFLAKHGK